MKLLWMGTISIAMICIIATQACAGATKRESHSKSQYREYHTISPEMQGIWTLVASSFNKGSDAKLVDPSAYAYVRDDSILLGDGTLLRVDKTVIAIKEPTVTVIFFKHKGVMWVVEKLKDLPYWRVQVEDVSDGEPVEALRMMVLITHNTPP